MTVDSNIKDTVRAFIADELEWAGPIEQLTDDASLIDAGVLDSLSLLELAYWLGDRYGIKVDDVDMVAVNFETLTLIEHFVQRGITSPARRAAP